MITTIGVQAYARIRGILNMARSLLGGNEHGQDLIEYAILAGAIGVALFTALAVAGFPTVFEDFGTSMKNCFDMKAATACP